MLQYLLKKIFSIRTSGRSGSHIMCHRRIHRLFACYIILGVVSLQVFARRHWHTCTGPASGPRSKKYVLPCQDTLSRPLGDSAENMTHVLTVYGHQCYDMKVSSPDENDNGMMIPTSDLYFVDKSVYLTFLSSKSWEDLSFIQLCSNNTRGCHVHKSGLFPHSEYLILLRSRTWNNASGASEVQSYLQIQACDPFSFGQWIVLLSCIALGISVATSLLCSALEYLMGVDCVAPKKSQSRFIELTQVDDESSVASSTPSEESQPSVV